MNASRGGRPAHLQVLAVAWNFGWPIASGVLLGYWLDQRLETSPALTLGFSVGAMGASVHRLLQLSARESAEAAEDAVQATGSTSTPPRADEAGVAPTPDPSSSDPSRTDPASGHRDTDAKP